MSYQVSWWSVSWRRSRTDIVVTSRASFLPFLGRKCRQSAELLFYEEQAENVDVKIRAVWDVTWCQLVTICSCLGGHCCLCFFSWQSHFTGTRTNPLSVGSQFFTSADMWRRCTVGVCVVYYFPKLMFFLGALLQIGRSLVRSQPVPLEFFIDIKFFRSHYGPGGRLSL